MELRQQYAHHAHHESESKQVARAEDVMASFDAFDWNAQVAKANELELCSPTLSVIRGSQDDMIWVSAIGEPNQISFVSEAHYPGEVPGFLGFGKKPGVIHQDTQWLSLQQAREALALFVAKDYAALEQLYRSATP